MDWAVKYTHGPYLVQIQWHGPIHTVPYCSRDRGRERQARLRRLETERVWVEESPAARVRAALDFQSRKLLHEILRAALELTVDLSGGAKFDAQRRVQPLDRGRVVRSHHIEGGQVDLLGLLVKLLHDGRTNENRTEH